MIFCEDTRVTAKLTARFSIPAPRISCPAPREGARVEELLERLSRGETVALVSDAGMPGDVRPGRTPGRRGGRGRACRRSRAGPVRSGGGAGDFGPAGRSARLSGLPAGPPGRAEARPGGPPEPHGDPRVVRGASPPPGVPGGRRAWSWAPAAPAWRGSSRSCTRKWSAGRCRRSPKSSAPAGPGRGEVTVVVEGASASAVAIPYDGRRRREDSRGPGRGRGLEAPVQGDRAAGRPAGAGDLLARAAALPASAPKPKPDPE